MLDRGDVHDDARPLCEHHGEQRAVEPHGGHQVEIHLLLPLGVTERGEPAGRRLRATEHVDQDVEAAERVPREPGHPCTAIGRGHVRCDVVDAFGRVGWHGACRGHDRDTVLTQDVDDRGAHTLRTRGHQCTTPGKTEIEAHAVIARRAMASPASVK